MCRTVNGSDINAQDIYLNNIYAIINDKKPTYEKYSSYRKDSRGNLAPVTLILPTLAMESKGDVEKFMSLLDKKIFEARDMLLERYEHMKNQPASSARFMYENNTMLGYKPEEGIESALKHGTLTIGQLGLAETLQILVGCDHTTNVGMELAKRIEQLFKDRCAQFKQEEQLTCSKKELLEAMIKGREKQIGKKVPNEEIEQINKFVDSKYGDRK